MKRLKTVLFAILLAALPVGAQDTEGELAKIKERELEQVRDRISALKKSMDRTATSRDRLTKELQDAEVAIAEKRIRLKELQRERDYSTRRKGELDKQLAEREAQLDDESKELADQVRAAYMSGSQERIKLLLNQRDPATLGRLMAYYGYLNDYRAENIEEVTAAIRELAKLRSEVAAEEARLSDIAKTRYSELAELGKAQEKRKGLLANLQDKMADEGREVERLAAQEKDLSRLIAELTSILSDYPISSEDPFTRGREVRVVYHGRVEFADWLAGMGLLVIVNHGEGYMTLYGYNETILKNSGDWVAPGDVIATVGDSGGQARAGLYFEIRRGTQPVNPRQWVTRRPGQ
jgi:septal ring factor EnvC (AmiA/AmiB activator)